MRLISSNPKPQLVIESDYKAESLDSLLDTLQTMNSPELADQISTLIGHAIKSAGLIPADYDFNEGTDDDSEVALRFTCHVIPLADFR